MLAALVPERVLPLASGESRKRWPGPKKPQWSAGRRAAGYGRGCVSLSGRGHRNWMRRSALRFPFFRDVVTVRALGEQASDATVHRENDRLRPPPHEVRGRGTILRAARYGRSPVPAIAGRDDERRCLTSLIEGSEPLRSACV